jgi:hypothetical protein
MKHHCQERNNRAGMAGKAELGKKNSEFVAAKRGERY